MLSITPSTYMNHRESAISDREPTIRLAYKTGICNVLWMYTSPQKSRRFIRYHHKSSNLSQLSWREGMTSAEPSINCPSLPIDIACTITAQEGRHSCDLVSNTSSSQRIQLTDLSLGAPLPCCCVHLGRHTSLDQPRTYCVASNTTASELIRGSLHDADDGCFGCRVVGSAGVGA
jgi:hypothetical protein